MKLIAGVTRPDEGEIYVEDKPIKFASPADAATTRDVRAHAVTAGDSAIAQEAEKKLRASDAAFAESEAALAPGEGELRIADNAFIRAISLSEDPRQEDRIARTVLRRGATQVKVCVSGGVVSLTDRIERYMRDLAKQV